MSRLLGVSFAMLRRLYHGMLIGMNIVQSIVLGIVQGLTEFIPVSSVGHLIIIRQVFNISDANGLAVDAILNLAAVCSVGIYFFSDLVHLVKAFGRMCLGRVIADKDKKLIFAIILGTIPAVIL